MPCVVHGNSIHLKNFVSFDNITVSQTILNNEQLLSELKKLYNIQTIYEMNKTLRLIENEETMFKVVFGKEIQKHIGQQTLKTKNIILYNRIV
jgi:hypothetical protein